MRVLIATLFVTGLALAGGAQPPEKQPEKQPDKPPDKPENPAGSDLKVFSPIIGGGYTVASGERDGKPFPKEALQDAIMRVTESRIVGTDRDRRELIVATYTLNTTKTPWTLELRHYGAKELTAGLVKKDGYKLTIIFALPGGEAPTEFKTKDKQVMFHLRGFVLDPLPPPNKFSGTP
jgi:uncharacterized protein (TIGR03067 family)